MCGNKPLQNGLMMPLKPNMDYEGHKKFVQ